MLCEGGSGDRKVRDCKREDRTERLRCEAREELGLEQTRTDDAGTTATPTPSTEEATARNTINDCVEQSGMFPRARSRAPSPERSVENENRKGRGKETRFMISGNSASD